MTELIRWDEGLTCLNLYGLLELKRCAPLSHFVFKIDIGDVKIQVNLYKKSVEIEDVVKLARLAYMKLVELMEEVEE